MAVSMKTLLEAGVHFGHQTRRWNPKMKPYIFTERSGIYILDLQRTLRELAVAYRFVRELTARGEHLMFVGTKKQAQESVSREAERSGQPYVNQRWLGGMLTNFVTMRTRVARMEELERMEEDGTMASLPKKEVLKLRAEHEKLLRNLAGVRDMKEIPAALFVIDTKREAIAVAEARRLRIPIIGLVDTNADPDEVDFVIPGNDDAIRAIDLMCRIMGDAAEEGRQALEGARDKEEPSGQKPGAEAGKQAAKAAEQRQSAVEEAGEKPAVAAAEAPVAAEQPAEAVEPPVGAEELEPETPGEEVESAPVE